MTKTLITAEEFKERAQRGQIDDGTVIRLAPVDRAGLSDGASVPFVLSDDSIDRYGDTVAADGWVLTPYRQNPVLLWAHDAEAPPIGRMTDIRVENGRLVGRAEFCDPDLYPFGDMIGRMVRLGYLNAGSVGFKPLSWDFSKDRERAGGIDYKRQELLEFSICPVPANQNALAQARSAGIDTTPFYEWAEKVLDGGGKVMVPRSEIETLRKVAKMPKAKRSTKSKPVLDAAVVKDLCHVSWLAWIINDLKGLQCSLEMDAEAEDEPSNVAAMVTDALKAAGQALLTLTQEEVADILAGEAAGMGPEDDMAAMCLSDGGRVVMAISKSLTQGAPTQKAGRVLSKANHEKLTSAHCAIGDVLRDAQPDAGGDDTDVVEQMSAALVTKDREIARLKAHVQALKAKAAFS